MSLWLNNLKEHRICVTAVVTLCRIIVLCAVDMALIVVALCLAMLARAVIVWEVLVRSVLVVLESAVDPAGGAAVALLRNVLESAVVKCALVVVILEIALVAAVVELGNVLGKLDHALKAAVLAVVKSLEGFVRLS